MNSRITGQQARELLGGTTPGPWSWEDRDYPDYDEGYEVLWNGAETALRSQDSEQYSSWVTGSDKDKALVAAAPALAATVEWLYGREVDDYRKLAHLTAAGSVAATPDAVAADFGVFTPDEAVDLARALLAASEKARTSQGNPQ